MGFGFDAIDKQFRPKKIVLECVDCPSTTDVKTHSLAGEEPALCEACVERRTTEQHCYLI